MDLVRRKYGRARGAGKRVDKGRSVIISGRLYRWLDPFLRSRLLRDTLLRLVGRR